MAWIGQGNRNDFSVAQIVSSKVHFSNRQHQTKPHRSIVLSEHSKINVSPNFLVYVSIAVIAYPLPNVDGVHFVHTWSIYKILMSVIFRSIILIHLECNHNENFCAVRFMHSKNQCSRISIYFWITNNVSQAKIAATILLFHWFNQA